MIDPADTRRPPSVLHVMWSLAIGGAEKAVYQLATAQHAAGVSTGVLVASELGLYGTRLRDAGVQVEALGQRGVLDPIGMVRAARRFAAWDIVHFHVPEPPLMLLASRTRASVFYTHRAGRFAYPVKRRLRYEAVGRIVRNGRWHVAANTRHAAEVAAGLFGLPARAIHVVYNGLDWSLLGAATSPRDVRDRLGIGGAEFVVGTSANLRPWKRVDLLLQAVSRTSRHVRCLVIGDGPDRGPLETLAAELGIASRVSFVGKQAEVSSFLRACDAFVLPTGPEESFGNAAVEAMGVGLPTIVLADGGGLTEHVRHCETGIVARDTDDVAQWLDILSADDGLRDVLARQGREYVRSRYTTRAMVEGYSRMYGSVLDFPVTAGSG
jgi:glycosyltransferase involved in cell wall biosynthesis